MRQALRLSWLVLGGLACGSEPDVADGGDVADLADDTTADAEEVDGPVEAADTAEDAETTEDGEDPLPPAENWDRDLRHVGLRIDLETLAGTADLVLDPSDRQGASFEAQGLEVRDVSDPGGPLEWRVEDGRLDVGVPAGVGTTLTVEYRFAVQPDFEGWSSRGWTLVWPNHCGNLYPCRSRPSEGQTFALEVAGVTAGRVAVYPAAVETEAPSYQIAWAVGEYERSEIGTTGAGTVIEAWTSSGDAAAAATGMADLPAVFDWYERTLGPYPFGDRAGAVAVNWPPGALGGMEHHPIWHVSRGALGMRGVHAHEAAHGWFGNGVRIARWEDLVLSEGTVSYLQARSLGRAVGPEAEAEVWDGYAVELDTIVSRRDRIAWPDPIADPVELEAFLFSRAPYIKGAYFYRAVADRVGADELDRLLGAFFAAHVGAAAGMQDLVDFIEAEAPVSLDDLVTGWLRSLGRP
jgi:hypothetical protein